LASARAELEERERQEHQASRKKGFS